MAEKGDVFPFGSWGGEALEWLVLDADETSLLAIAKTCPDAKAWHNERVPMTWKDCSLRAWLNGEFCENAFSAEEKQRILPTVCSTPDSIKYKTPGCGETEDRVFVLSFAEADALFEKPVERQVQPGAFADQNGAYKNAAGLCWWWLRDPGVRPDYAATVSIDGWTDAYGHLITDAYVGVRPVIRISNK